ncbi:TPA: sigma-70 family RNA polymerase sigma factor, partial [Candidatus Micrarchaeota archaeon]|nr:sigma-70 family RNA polymerase sigma factor [Candidatus Micrarchaeota archaeon]
MQAVISSDVVRKQLPAKQVSRSPARKPSKFLCLTPMQEARIALIREEKFADKTVLTHSEERFLFEVFSGLAKMGKELNAELDSGRLNGRTGEVTRKLAEVEVAMGKLEELIAQVNRRFSHSLALQLSEKLNFRVRPEDLAPIGDTGLLIAIRRFDHRRGTKFITYAQWWVNKKMYDALPSLLEAVRTPSHAAEKTRHVRRFSYGFLQTNQREPTPEEVAEGLGLSIQTVEDASKAKVVRSAIPERLLRSRFMGPEMLVMLRERRDAVRKALKCLSPEELHVITRRFGLGNREEETLKQVGDDYMHERSVTRENVRQVEVRALGKLRR